MHLRTWRCSAHVVSPFPAEQCVGCRCREHMQRRVRSFTGVDPDESDGNQQWENMRPVIIFLSLRVRVYNCIIVLISTVILTCSPVNLAFCYLLNALCSLYEQFWVSSFRCFLLLVFWVSCYVHCPIPISSSASALQLILLCIIRYPLLVCIRLLLPLASAIVLCFVVGMLFSLRVHQAQ